MNPTLEQEEAYFDEFGYQMETADFVAFVLEEAEEGVHDIFFVNPGGGTVHYGFVKMTYFMMNYKNSIRDICLAVETIYGSIYPDQDYTHGFLLVRSYTKQDGASFDFTDPTLRGYQITRGEIQALYGDILEERFGSLNTNISSYADAWWPYEGMKEGRLRLVADDGFAVLDVEER